MNEVEKVARAMRSLVDAIINDYHTTRLRGTDIVGHILSKPRTKAAIAALDEARGDPVAKVVAWLRACSLSSAIPDDPAQMISDLADALERGEHLK